MITSKININRITRQQLFVWLKIYAENIGIKIYFINNTRGDCCLSFLKSRTIHLSIKYKKASLVFCFFHEIAHFIALDKGLFKIANSISNENDYNKLSAKEKIVFKRTNLKLEKWCDTFGENESLKYFSNPNCYKPYHEQYGREHLKLRYNFK